MSFHVKLIISGSLIFIGQFPKYEQAEEFLNKQSYHGIIEGQI